MYLECLELQVKLPIELCEFKVSAIVSTDIIGSLFPNTLDAKEGWLFAEGVITLQLHH